MASSVYELETLLDRRASWSHRGLTVGLVPTMGALHAGHLSLIGKAKAVADRVVVSIYVNPKQFAPGEDQESYPRDAENDCAQALAAGADLVWLCPPDSIYPKDWATSLVPSGVGLGLESNHRPHFFTGVATVVARLFALLKPQFAVFGEKDFQQLKVVEQLNRDLCFGVTIIAAPLVRGADCLALSSRNRNLSSEQHEQALAVPRSLQAVCSAYAEGERSTQVLCQLGRSVLTDSGLAIDYFELVKSSDLQPAPRELSGDDTDLRLMVAALCGTVRLIDNCALDTPPCP
jgi:pantoate--beta-alanine ligase